MRLGRVRHPDLLVERREPISIPHPPKITESAGCGNSRRSSSFSNETSAVRPRESQQACRRTKPRAISAAHPARPHSCPRPVNEARRGYFRPTGPDKPNSTIDLMESAWTRSGRSSARIVRRRRIERSRETSDKEARSVGISSRRKSSRSIASRWCRTKVATMTSNPAARAARAGSRKWVVNVSSSGTMYKIRGRAPARPTSTIPNPTNQTDLSLQQKVTMTKGNNLKCAQPVD
ncbi:hypothetical protein ABIF29_008159 [Bradyrhizobium elkanii]|uniref:Uncharacterized protein n=1 Tax=Bradyrhizobium elkanii TaxID=29448 RepID=A0ABV4FEJ9_BRAEL